MDVGLLRGLLGVADGALAAQNRGDQLLGFVDGAFIGLHDVEALALGGVALAALAAGTGHGAALDVPAGEVPQLHPDQRGDLLLRKAGHEAVGNGVHELGETHQNGGGLELVRHGVDDLHLVDAALDVAGSESVALPRKGQRALAVQMVPALGEGGGVIVAGAAHRGEGLIGVDVHAAYGIDDADEARKVDADVVVHLDAVQVAQRGHAGLHTVQAGMGQLILAVSARQIHVVIAGSVDEGDPLGGGVDHSEDVHVTAGFFGQLAAVVHAAEVEHKRLLGDLVGLCAGDQAGGDVIQRGKALLRPDTADGQHGAQKDREHAGNGAGGLVFLTALDQQPEQHQQCRNDDEVEGGQHLGAAELDERRHAEDGLYDQQNGTSLRGLVVISGRAAGRLRGRGAALFRGLLGGRRRRRLGRFRRKERRAVYHHRFVRVVPGTPVHMPGSIFFIEHRKTPFDWSLRTAGRWSAPRGRADRWPTDPLPRASRSLRRCGRGRASLQSGPRRP